MIVVSTELQQKIKSKDKLQSKKLQNSWQVKKETGSVVGNLHPAGPCGMQPINL